MLRTVLVVEDDVIQSTIVTAYLTRTGWEVQTCASAEEAICAWDEQHPDVVVTDLRLPGMSGIEMLQKMRESDELVKCIVMTVDDSVRTAVQAMKAGAFDYLIKPIGLSELGVLLERVIGIARMEQALQFHQERQALGAGLQLMIGESSAMQKLKAQVWSVIEAERRITHGSLPALLIVGETGTGKELVARSTHFDGVRASGPFIEINCASIPSTLLESELFGHERGAFTDAKERRTGLVEAADGGTLFLDEIGEIDLSLQAKLLKLIEEKTVRRIGATKERQVNLRIISATNRDLEGMVKEGTFRSDLYFRLRIISIQVPALRDRGDDILLLARYFLESHARRYGKPRLRFSPETEQALLHYYWPGNVRELRNMLEQTVLLAAGEVITPEQLTLSMGLAPRSGEQQCRTCGGSCVAPPKNDSELTEVARSLVVKTLQRTAWNVTRTAKLLGLSRDMMRYRIDKMGLTRPSDEPGSGFDNL